jgi:hypothetical protein
MNEIDAEEFDTLAQILEGEQQSHKRRRSLCMSMFVTFFVLFILALLLLGLHMAGVVAAEQQQDGLLSQLSFVSTLGTLGTAVFSAFGVWWASENCLNSIERTLLAARARKQRLFITLFGQIQCADEKKRRILLDLIKGSLG